MPGLLTRKASMRFGIEATVGTNPGLATADAIEIADPNYTTDVNVLQREYVTNDLSPFEDRIGRILAGFEYKTMLGGNGKVQSGNAVDNPLIAKMINACGYNLVQMTGPGTTNHGPMIADANNATLAAAPVVAWVSSITAVTITKPVLLTLQVVLGGASGTATVSVTSNDTAVQPNIAATVITSGTPFTLGNCGTITPTWTGPLVAGQIWSIAVFSKGVKCVPVSTGQKTASIELNRDGIKLEGNAGLGTFQIEATAGEYCPISFKFVTTFVDPVGGGLPDDDIPSLNPPMVELAAFTWGGNKGLMVEKFSYEQENQIEARPSVNSAKGYFGSRITSRKPKGGFNPEAELEADHPFWADFTKSKAKTLFARIGTDVGNIVVLYTPKSQTTDVKFGDRSGIMTYENTFAAKRNLGDDETIIAFC